MIKRICTALLVAAAALTLEPVQAAHADDPEDAIVESRLHFHDCFVQGCDAAVLLREVERSVAPSLDF